MSIATIPEPRVFSQPVVNGRKDFGPVADDSLYEIVHGQRVELPPMSFFAILIASRLNTALSTFVEAHQLGTSVTEALFILAGQEKIRRRPDVAFVSHHTWPRTRPFPKEGDLEVVPDLAVEVVSPTDLAEQVFAKIVEYFHYGVKQVWMILPTLEMVYVYDSLRTVRVVTEDQELADTIIPGFRWHLRELFQPHPKP